MRRDAGLPFFTGPLARVARAALQRATIQKPAWAALQSLHVGLAHVRQITPEGLPVVRLDDTWGSTRVAEWALPYRYEPAVGDMLLTAALGERCYVIGVAHGRGLTRLAFRGDVRIGARGGLRLVATKAIRLRSAQLSLRARGVLKTRAVTIHEKLGDAVRAVKGLLDVRARECARVVEGEESVVAREVQLIAADAVVFDGEKILVS